jgi:hypothetical protein
MYQIPDPALTVPINSLCLPNVEPTNKPTNQFPGQVLSHLTTCMHACTCNTIHPSLQQRLSQQLLALSLPLSRQSSYRTVVLTAQPMAIMAPLAYIRQSSPQMQSTAAQPANQRPATCFNPASEHSCTSCRIESGSAMACHRQQLSWPVPSLLMQGGWTGLMQGNTEHFQAVRASAAAAAAALEGRTPSRIPFQDSSLSPARSRT